MENIGIIIPVHQFNNDNEKTLLNNALENVRRCQENYQYKLTPYIVGPEEVLNTIEVEENVVKVTNTGETDFCSQINVGVSQVKEDYFSILEFDDEYNEKWFKMANDYYYSNEDVSLFLPINVDILSTEGYRQFGNEAPWAMQFSKELGYIDFKCLENYYSFNITGGIFNKADFIRIGGLKPSIKVAFNYELLLRMTSKNLKVFVVPKEGYHHLIGRENSLIDIYSKIIKTEEINEWYAMAMQEYKYENDRKTSVGVDVSENNE